MKNDNRYTSVIFLIFVSLFLFSCDKDSDGDGKNDPGTSITDTFVKLDVSGEVNESLEGYMSFYPFEFLTSTTWQLSGNNFSPQTFTVNFRITDSNEPLPGPGSYKLEDEPFIADFEYIEDGDFENAKQYTLDPNKGNSGTIKIESIDDKFMTGSFNFNAVRLDDLSNQVLGEVQVSGTFKALKDE